MGNVSNKRGSSDKWAVLMCNYQIHILKGEYKDDNVVCIFNNNTEADAG